MFDVTVTAQQNFDGKRGNQLQTAAPPGTLNFLIMSILRLIPKMIMPIRELLHGFSDARGAVEIDQKSQLSNSV